VEAGIIPGTAAATAVFVWFVYPGLLQGGKGMNKIEAAVRALRGGSWGNSPSFCRSAGRSGDYHVYRDNFSGFRVVRVPGTLLVKKEDKGERIARGSSWLSLPGSCRSLFRSFDDPSYCNGFLGFRMARVPKSPSGEGRGNEKEHPFLPLRLWVLCLRSCRGSSWWCFADKCRPVHRMNRSYADIISHGTGFRTVCSTSTPPVKKGDKVDGE